jgi:hypothetical protein
MKRQELLRSANRRVLRARRATGRIVVSALGFGVAYYFDTENGAVRRKRLHEMVQRTVRNIEAVRASDVGDAPPVFHPAVQAFRAEGRTGRGTEHVEAVQ